MSLERALSKLGIASRSDAHALVRAGRVSVNGRTVRDPGRPVHPERMRFAVDGVNADRAAWRTIVFYKPRGVVTTRRDPEGRRTVFDVLGDAAAGLVAVGRLDAATTGLLVLTTDTQLADHLADPRSGVIRRYVVTVRGALTDDEAARMVDGVDDLRARAVHVRKRSGRETHLVVELDEGKNREIRRLCGAVGHEVTSLKRVAFGPLELGRLQPGQWREVTSEELAPVAAPAARRRRR